MSTDLFKQVLFNDGEGITHTDLNDAQRFVSAELFDQVMEKLVGGLGLTSQTPEFFGGSAPTHLAYCLAGGQAFLRQGSGNNKLQIAPGTLFQKVGSDSGDEASFLAYTFAGTEEVTIANNAGVNPRVDILQMKLEYVAGDSQSRDFEDGTTHVITSTSMNKKRRVQCTLSVKQGTVAASPTYPDPDAGYVCVAGIVVNTSYAAVAGFDFGIDNPAATAASVHDQRMPLRITNESINAKDYWLKTAYTLNYGTTATQSAGTNVLQIVCPVSSVGRVVGIRINLDADTIASSRIFGQHPVLGVQMQTNLDIAARLPTSGREDHMFPYWEFEGTHSPSSGPTIQKSATNKIGPPIWTNGLRCAVAPLVPPAIVDDGFAFIDPTIVEINDLLSPGVVYSHCSFYVAR